MQPGPSDSGRSSKMVGLSTGVVGATTNRMAAFGTSDSYDSVTNGAFGSEPRSAKSDTSWTGRRFDRAVATTAAASQPNRPDYRAGGGQQADDEGVADQYQRVRRHDERQRPDGRVRQRPGEPPVHRPPSGCGSVNPLEVQ